MDLLTEILGNDKIDLANFALEIRMIERKRYLSEHHYSIRQGKDGAWYTYLPDESKSSKRKQVKRTSRSKLEAEIIKYYQSLEENPTLEEVFTEWNDRRLEMGRIKASTHFRNKQIFDRHYEDFGNKRIKEILPIDISDFLETEAVTKSLSRKAYSNLKSITRGFLRRAKKRKLILFDIEPALTDIDISDKEFKSEVKPDSQEIFYDDEAEAVLSYCKEHSDDIKNVGIALLFATGMRVGELVALKGTDLRDGMVVVSKTETRFKADGHYVFEVSERPKTEAGIRSIIVPDKYQWVIDILPKTDDYIFTNKKGERLHTQAIYKALIAICKKLEICERSPHKVRKTYGSILLDNGVDVKLIEKQMGHTDISCTEAHYHRDRRRLDEKRDILNSIPEFRD